MTKPDFPFYDGQPVALSCAQWALVMLAVAAAFGVLHLPTPERGAASWLPPVLFAVLPLLALRLVAGPSWRALFAPVSLRDVGLAFGVALLNILATIVIALGVDRLFGASANPAMALLAQADLRTVLLFLLQSLPQLLGEELLTLLPFLAVMAALHRRGWRRRSALLAAWLLSAVVFAAAHLPTYDWHVAQCFLVIGSARLILNLAYVFTRNVWVPTLAHIFNDWLLIAAVLVFETAPV